MSTIVVVVRSDQPSADLIRRLREATAKPMGEVRRALVTGAPLVSERLFFNDHEERAAVLRALVSAVADAGVTAEAYEMEEGETYVEGACDDNRFDLPEVLEILAEWDRRLARIHELDDKKARSGGPDDED